MEISEKKKKKGGTFGNVVDFAGGGVDEKPFGDLLLLVVAEIRFPGIVVGHVRCLLSFPLSPGVSGCSSAFFFIEIDFFFLQNTKKKLCEYLSSLQLVQASYFVQ